MLDRLDPLACYLELDGERIPAVPAFDAPATRATGLTGTLSLSGHDEAILVAKLTPRSVYTGEYERLRRDTAHRALVIVCSGARPGMGLLNAERFRNPYGAPAIHVSSEASETVLAGAARAAPARVVAESRYVRQLPATSSWQSRGPPLLSPSRGHDAAQLVVAVDRRAGRRPRLLARIIARADCGPARLRRGLYRK